MFKFFLIFPLLASIVGNLFVLAASSSPDWISYLLNGGPFAVVVLLIIMDKLTTTGERDRLRAENEVLRSDVKKLNEDIRLEIVPPLVQLNLLMKDVVKELSKTNYIPPEGRELR